MTRRNLRFLRGARQMTVAAVLMTTAVAISCGGSGEDDTETSGRLNVVTTVSPITSIVENIGGQRILVRGIVPEGANSHTFDPPPSTARVLAEADLFIANGLFLEEPAIEMFDANHGDNARIVLLGERAITPEEWQFDFSFPEANGQPNPHLWPDPLLALKYAEIVRDELTTSDPDGATYYGANYEVFRERIESLDSAIKTAVATVPEGHRVLLTYHDSWAYFARRYGFTVLGAVQPADFTEPSPREMASLIVQVRDLGVPAIFGSEVFPSPVMEQIAAESGAVFIDELADDDLPGEPGDMGHSYLGLMAKNMESMIRALGGDVSALGAVDTSLVFDGGAVAQNIENSR
ncbi:MAG: metal ABC transporter substrate-binding protein [Chloroflexi bacterium]|nr:metal ABC transporter substrate-binding protein [Chloroflexota bacterium]